MGRQTEAKFHLTDLLCDRHTALFCGHWEQKYILRAMQGHVAYWNGLGGRVHPCVLKQSVNSPEWPYLRAHDGPKRAWRGSLDRMVADFKRSARLEDF